MKVAFTTITTNDLFNSLKFYKDIIGLTEFRRIKPQEGVQCVFLKDEKNSVIELIEYKNEVETNIENKESIVSIGFSVNNLDETLEMLKSNAIEIIRGPIEAPGVKFVFVKDPNGVEVELIEGFDV